VNRIIFAKIFGLVACCALGACVNLTPPWEKHRDAGRSETTLPTTNPDAGADSVTTDRSAPTPDAEEPPPAIDAPGVEDTAVGADGGSADDLLGRDAAGERTIQGDARIDGLWTTDGAREAGFDVRAGSEDAGDSDSFLRVDATTSTDSAPDVSDTNASDLPIDAALSGRVKLTGTAFGTGPAFPAHPTATFDKAFDGDPTTFFDDSHSGGGTTGIDVGGAAVVKSIRYYPREDFNDRMLGGKFQCSPSSQTEGYVDLFTVTAVPPLEWTEVSVTAAPSCRFFRYLAPADSFCNVGEIEFWTANDLDGGTDLGVSLVNLALGQPASASSEQTSSRKFITNGNDGVVSTVFCPADNSFPVWYQVDLGAVRDIQETDITVEAAPAAYQYQIDVSLDGAEWTLVAAHGSGVAGGRSTVSDDFQAQARYVRVTITGVSNGQWGCLREFMVWGYPASSTDGGVERD
jgi:hypothetical protein